MSRKDPQFLCVLKVSVPTKIRVKQLRLVHKLLPLSFFDKDHICKVKTSEKNIYLVKFVYSDSSFKVDVPVEKDLPLVSFFMNVTSSEKTVQLCLINFKLTTQYKLYFFWVVDILKTFYCLMFGVCLYSISSVT